MRCAEEGPAAFVSLKRGNVHVAGATQIEVRPRLEVARGEGLDAACAGRDRREYGVRLASGIERFLVEILAQGTRTLLEQASREQGVSVAQRGASRAASLAGAGERLGAIVRGARLAGHSEKRVGRPQARRSLREFRSRLRR